MPDGKYFFIKSKLNDLVLDIEGGASEPGTLVITWSQKADDNDNQIWYEDNISGTIRSKSNDLCLDIQDDVFVINEYEADRVDQQWMTTGDKVQNRQDPNRVLDIKGAQESEGASIIAYAAHNDDNQKWIFERLPAKFFYVRSLMHGKVLDLKKKELTPGTKVIMQDKSAEVENSQLWYENLHGVICDKHTNFVLDSSAEKLRLEPYYPGNTEQLWVFQDDRIVNRVHPNRVLDIKGAKKKNGAKLISHMWNGHDNQKWALDFV